MNLVFFGNLSMPKDPGRLSLWTQNIGSFAATPLRGMICINHFAESSIKPATKTKAISLKSDAVPTIFMPATSDKCDSQPSQHDETDETEQYALESSTGTACSNEACTRLRAEYDELDKKFKESTIQYDQKMEKLQVSLLS